VVRYGCLSVDRCKGTYIVPRGRSVGGNSHQDVVKLDLTGKPSSGKH